MKFRDWKIFILCLALIVCAACGGKNLSLAEIPSAPNAEKKELARNFAIPFRLRVAELYELFRDKDYGNFQTEFYLLPNSTEWRTVALFYDEKLSAAGYKRIFPTNFPDDDKENSFFEKRFYWEKRGAGGKHAIGVSVFTARHYLSAGENAAFETQTYLIIATAEKPFWK